MCVCVELHQVTVDAAKAVTKQAFADNLEVKLQKAKARRSALLYQRQSVAIKHNIRYSVFAR